MLVKHLNKAEVEQGVRDGREATAEKLRCTLIKILTKLSYTTQHFVCFEFSSSVSLDFNIGLLSCCINVLDALPTL